jgi:hypothetical protein
LALDSIIQSTKTILYNVKERARVWTTDVDNADQAVDFFVIVSQWLSHCQDRLPGVDIYLQCPHKDPMAFYSACGFLQVNLQDTTGIELLPKTIADALCNKNAQAKSQGSCAGQEE